MLAFTFTILKNHIQCSVAVPGSLASPEIIIDCDML